MVRYGINLIRNIHDNLRQAGQDGALDDNQILLETTAEAKAPFLVLRRGGDIGAPFDSAQPIAHVFDLQYVIDEFKDDAADLFQEDQVAMVRALDEAFMKRVKTSPLFRFTTDVEEGLSEDRSAYILSRSLELAADLPVNLNAGLES